MDLPRLRAYFLALIAFALILSPLSLAAQHSPSTMQRNLTQLTAEAQTIVRGEVVSAVAENHPTLTHLPTVLVTLKVAETLKGSPQESITFRQFVFTRGGTVPSEYRPGQTLVLMLRPTSQYGFTAPAGLEQGVFRISRISATEETAVNGRGNIGLFQNLPAQLSPTAKGLSANAAKAIRQSKPGPVDVKTLSELIRRALEVQ